MVTIGFSEEHYVFSMYENGILLHSTEANGPEFNDNICSNYYFDIGYDDGGEVT